MRHSQYHCTTAQIKSSNHTSSLHSLTSCTLPYSSFQSALSLLVRVFLPLLFTRNCIQLNWHQSVSYVTTDGQPASLSWCQAPIWGLRPDFYYCQTAAGLLMWGALSDERRGLPFTITAGPRQRSHSWVWVPRDSWPYFTLSHSRLPQPGGPGSRIYISQEQGGSVIPPGTGSLFRRLLLLAGLGGGIRTRLHTGLTTLLTWIHFSYKHSA
jgi:hypothetical protein